MTRAAQKVSKHGNQSTLFRFCHTSTWARARLKGGATVAVEYPRHCLHRALGLEQEPQRRGVAQFGLGRRHQGLQDVEEKGAAMAATKERWVGPPQ